ncbi:hypothetical protein ABIB51_001348 [Arthrobacter sp. UYCu712]
MDSEAINGLETQTRKDSSALPADNAKEPQESPGADAPHTRIRPPVTFRRCDWP